MVIIYRHEQRSIDDTTSASRSPISHAERNCRSLHECHDTRWEALAQDRTRTGGKETPISTADRMKEWDTCALKQFSAQQAGSTQAAYLRYNKADIAALRHHRDKWPRARCLQASWSRCESRGCRDVNPSNNGQKLQFATRPHLPVQCTKLAASRGR